MTLSNKELIKLFHESEFVNFQKFLDWYWDSLDQGEEDEN